MYALIFRELSPSGVRLVERRLQRAEFLFRGGHELRPAVMGVEHADHRRGMPRVFDQDGLIRLDPTIPVRRVVAIAT